MSYLLDADWAINALAGRSETVEALQKLAADGIAISLITVGEIYEGAFGLPNPEAHIARFREFVQPLRLITLSDEIMFRFAEIRSALRRNGQLIPDFDILLGATALQYDLTVLTSNYKHLLRIPKLKVYHPA